MKPTLAFLILSIACIQIQAQNYLVSFVGTGASYTVDSVKVENLSQCTNLTLAGSDILNLTGTIGINEPDVPVEGFVKVYPNPSPGNCSIEFESASSENVRIGLCDLSGRTIAQLNSFITKGHHSLRLSGINEGLYLVSLESDHYRYTAKLISYGVSADAPEIQAITNEFTTDGRMAIRHNSGKDKVGADKSVIVMQYNEGDTLKLTGKSGDYKTICMLFPTQDQLVTFDFVKCTDADSNNYAVVQIGMQLWMEENLKATHYCDGSEIDNITDSATWGSISYGAYCNFHNDTAEGDQYGRLYNFYSVADARGICPVGWHVATNSEWNIMEKFLDPTVDTTALMGRGELIGRILKEGCDTRWQYSDSTYGWNSAGFTALCSNFRNATGGWSLAPDNNHDDGFWTSTAYSSTMAWGTSLRWCFGDIYVIFNFYRAGQSVRCVRDGGR